SPVLPPSPQSLPPPHPCCHRCIISISLHSSPSLLSLSQRSRASVSLKTTSEINTLRLKPSAEHFSKKPSSSPTGLCVCVCVCGGRGWTVTGCGVGGGSCAGA